MLKIAICDDEKAFLNKNAEYIDRIMKSHGIEYSLELYQDCEVLYNTLKLNPNQYDILLLDIIFLNQDDAKNGLEFASELRRLQNNISIIFISSSKDFLLEGYECEPSGYILKPVNIQKLEAAVIRAYKSIKHKTITISTKSDMQSFLLDDILYIEITNKTAAFYLSDGKMLKTNRSLQEIKQKLPAERFVQCHRSFVVNITKIFSIRRYQISLINHKIIPVSKNSYDLVQKAILNWTAEL